jgi:hypothetical protein
MVGAALRFAALSAQSFDEDETVTVWLLHHSLAGTLRMIPHTESTPPLYYVLVWWWSRMFGTGVVALRSLSALFGVATIPVCALAARQLAGRRAGIFAALLTGLSPALIWYSQEARSGALLVLTSAASLLFFANALARLQSDDDSPGRVRRALGLWALVASSALLAHYFAVFLVAVEAAWLLAAAGRGRRRAVDFALGAVAVVGIALLPLALTQQAHNGDKWIGSLPLVDRLLDVPPQLLLGEGRPFFHLYALATGLATVLPVLVLLLRGPSAERRTVLLPILLGTVAIALPILIDLGGMHILIDRNALGAGAVLLVAFAIGMASCSARRFGLVALLAVCCLFAWDLDMVHGSRLMQREDWRGAARALGGAREARAILYAPATNNPPPTPPLVPFQAVYLRDLLTMPDRGWNVREIDVLNVREDLSNTSPLPKPISPGHSFRLVARAGQRTFTLFRFVARKPVRVTPMS